MLPNFLRKGLPSLRILTAALSVSLIAGLSACASEDGERVVFANPGNVLSVNSTGLSPDPARPGDTVTLLQNITASNGLTSASVDFSAIGAGTVNLVDDGTGGDMLAGDGIYTAQAVVSAATSDGRKTLLYALEDTKGFTFISSTSVLIDSSSPAIESFTQQGASVTRMTPVLLSAQVESLTALTSVSVDLSNLGGSNNFTLNDDGANGDATADDGLWSANYTIPQTVAVGSRGLTISALASNGKTAVFPGVLVVQNVLPTLTVAGSGLISPEGNNEAGPGDVLEINVVASDSDGPLPSCTIDLTNFGGASDTVLAWDANDQRFEGMVTVPGGQAPGAVIATARVIDSDGASTSLLLTVNIRNWAGIAGSASNHGIADSLGWTFGSACVTDEAGNIYVAYSRRVNVPTTIANSGWMYAVYVKMYDANLGFWTGLGGSDSGYGLNLTTAGRVISSGYMGDIAYYKESHRGDGNNKEAIYIAFHGDPDPNPGDNHWDSFLYRWNITDQEWEALGTGVDASDYITDTPTDGVQDAGGFTRTGNRGQEPRIAFDSATDDVYMSYHSEDAPVTENYACYVKRFNRTTGVWEVVSGATPDDGISDDASVDYKYPQIAIHNGMAYVAYISGASAGNVYVQRGDLVANTWEAPVLVHDTTGGIPGGGFPSIVMDSTARIYVGFKVTFTTGGTDQQVHVATAPSADWSNPAAWTGAGGGARNVAISPSTSSSAIRTRLAIDSQDRVYTTFNQAHAGMSGSQRNIYVARWNGSEWRGVLGSLSGDGISSYPSEIDWLPWICVDPNDNPIVCWDTYWGPTGGSANDRRKIYVKRVE